MIFLSIVVPVYNVELYLEKCLDSIFNSNIEQKYYEVIAIDDGSTDSSLEILKKYDGIYDNLRIISQENSGLGATRNKGVTLSKGQYVWFIDSDDWIEPNAMSAIVDVVSVETPDIINIDFRHSTGEKSTVKVNAKPLTSYSGIDYLLLSNIHNPAQYYVINLEFYRKNGLHFEETIYHEDSLFTPIALSLAKKVIFLEQDCYIYNIRENSIMTSGGKNYKHAADMYTVVTKMISFIQNNKNNKATSFAINKYIAIGVGAIHYYAKQLNFSQKRELSKKIAFSPLLQAIVKSRKYKYVLSLLSIKFMIYIS